MLRRLERIEAHLGLTDAARKDITTPAQDGVQTEPQIHINTNARTWNVNADELATSALEDIAAGRVSSRRVEDEVDTSSALADGFYAQSIFIESSSIAAGTGKFPWDAGKTSAGLLQAFLAVNGTRDEYFQHVHAYFTSVGWVTHVRRSPHLMATSG